MASTDARPVPEKNVAYRVTFPIMDADGDLVTGATGLDTEISKDAGTFADCTNEATEIATSSGMYYLDLTSTEMNADCVALIVKTSSSGAKTTPIVLYPEEAGDIRVNLTQISGSAVSTSTAQLGVNVVQAAGTAWGSGAITAASIASDAITAAKVADGTIDAATFAAGAINAAAIASDAITDAKVASDVTIASVTGAVGSVTGAVGSVTGAVGSVTGNVGGNVTGSVGSVATGGIASASFAVGAINAAAIASDAITDAKVASDVTIASVTGAVGSVSGAVGSVTGNVGGSVASVTAGVTVTTNNDKTGYALTSGERTSVADAILDRDMSTGTDSGSTTVRTMRQALRFLRNKWSISGTTLTVCKEDDSTSSWTSTVTATSGADPITANDPAGP